MEFFKNVSVPWDKEKLCWNVSDYIKLKLPDN